MSDFSPPILRTWLQPLEVEQFLQDYWTREVWWAAGNADRLRFTEGLLPAVDLVGLLEHAVDPINAWYVDGAMPVQAFTVGSKQALHAYRAGLTVYFHLDSVVSAKFVAQLGRQLLRAPMAFNVSIFASRRGGHSTQPHVDGNENFTIQLRGTKRWKISPGVEWPGLNGKSQAHEDKSDPELYRMLQQPAHWNEVEPLQMSPGSFLYCPAKFWHTVETVEDSLSLNISIDRLHTWATALLPAIRARLLCRAGWESRDVGMWYAGKEREEAETIIRTLLKRLKEDVANIESEDVMAAWKFAEGETFPDLIPSHFIRNPFVSCELMSTSIGSQFSVRLGSLMQQGMNRVLTFSWELYEPFLKLMSTVGVRSTAEVQNAAELLPQFLRHGVFRPYDKT